MSGSVEGSADGALQQQQQQQRTASSSSSSSPSFSDRFQFLRSLRDLLFGRRRRRGRDAVASVPRVKSSRSLDDDLASTASTDSDANRLTPTDGSSDVVRPK